MAEESSHVVKTTVARAVWVVVGGMMISRLLGYVRLKAIAYNFGMNFRTDAFTAAFNVPDLLYFLVSGGALTASFIPVLTGYLSRGEDEEGWKVTNVMLNLMLLVVPVLIGIGMIIAPFLVSALQPGFKGETFDLTVLLVRILYPMVLFTSLSALCNGVLHSFNHFAAPAAAWSVYDIAIIAAAFLLGGLFGIQGLCYGVLVGAAGMVLVQAPVIFRKGFRYHFTLDTSHPGVREALWLFFPAMLGLAISQINLFIMPNLFGSYFAAGAVTSLALANRLILLPIGVFGNALAMAVFPALSRQTITGQMAEFDRTLAKGLRMTFLFSLPSTVFFIVIGVPVCRLLFEGNKFTMADSERTAVVLACYAMGLAGHGASQIITRGFYALKDTRTPLYVGLVGVACITIPISVFSIRSGYYPGIPLALSATAIFSAAALYCLLRKKRSEMDTAGVVTSFVKALVSAGLMWLVCVWARSAFEARLTSYDVTKISLGVLALEVCVVGGAGAAVFATAAHLLRVPEFSTLVQSVMGRLSRKRNAKP